jgi:hypothetical protein
MVGFKTEEDLIIDSPMGVTDDEILEEIMPDESRQVRRAKTRKANREYPKPTEQDVITLKNDLEGEWQEWRFGTTFGVGGGNSEDFLGASDFENGAATMSNGIPGLARVRQLRYHRDQMPAKYLRYMNSNYRFRTNWTASEIDRTVALATRNSPKVTIAPGSREPKAADIADRETRWSQYLLPTLERQAMKPLFRMFADGLFEGGLAGFEIFLTDSYDDLDLEQDEDESDDDYLARTDDQLMRASANRLPVGIRVPDPMSILYREDDLGICQLLIVETKPYQIVFNELSAKMSPEQITKAQLPKPGTSGWPQYYDSGWGTPSGNVLTVRYYDRRWYGFMVAGRWVDGPVEHRMPGVPFIPAWGTTTSSSRRAEQLQGVAWGMVEMEQATNDLLSTALDIEMTYGRPKPVIETSENGQLRDPSMGPQTIKLDDPDKAPELMPGQRLKDAYAEFGSRLSPGLLNVMMSIRAQSGMSPISAGESPGSDPSGFAVNTLQAAGQMRYEILLDNFGRAIAMLVDFIRRMIKEGPISDKVFVPVMNQKGEIEYLGLGPDDITSMPAEVFIDPMNDVNRLAIRQSLIAGNQAGYVPRAIVQAQGYGADDPRMWDNQIAEDVADQQLMGMALEVAKMRIAMQNTPQDMGLVGPRGEPLRKAGDDNELRGLGGLPREDRGTGRMGRSDGGNPPQVASALEANGARSRGGQQPSGQGVPANVPAGAA